MTVLGERPNLKYWAGFLWNAEGEGPAQLALRYWDDQEPWEALQYFRRHPHPVAVPKLRAVSSLPSGYESLSAQFALLKLRELKPRTALENCIGQSGWVVDETVDWINEQLVSGDLTLKKDERQLLELVEMRRKRND